MTPHDHVALRVLGDAGGDGRPLAVLDLFSGVGAYSLGLERTGGFETVAFCEINAFCRRILKQHWPHVPIFEDVTELTGAELNAAGIVPDWIVAGWPCQGNSLAGTGLGMDDPRSGLWSEIRRLAGELRPEGLLLENSSNLLNINGGADFGAVLGDLAALGYDAEWHCLPAAAFDAPHIRDRVWIVATLTDADTGQRDHAREALRARRHAAHVGRSDAADAEVERRHKGRLSKRARPKITVPGGHHQHDPHADADGEGLAVGAENGGGAGGARAVNPGRAAERVASVPDPSRLGRQPRRPQPAGQQGRPQPDGDHDAPHAHRLAPVGTAIARAERVSWQSLSDFRGMVHGDAEELDGFAVTSERVANRVERIHALGNLNPPIIPESIGRAILAARTAPLPPHKRTAS